jgi:hypothetical protein
LENKVLRSAGGIGRSGAAEAQQSIVLASREAGKPVLSAFETKQLNKAIRLLTTRRAHRLHAVKI